MRDNGVGVHGGCSNEFARWSVSHGGSEEIHDLGGSLRHPHQVVNYPCRFQELPLS